MTLGVGAGELSGGVAAPTLPVTFTFTFTFTVSNVDARC